MDTKVQSGAESVKLEGSVFKIVGPSPTVAILVHEDPVALRNRLLSKVFRLPRPPRTEIRT